MLSYEDDEAFLSWDDFNSIKTRRFKSNIAWMNSCSVLDIIFEVDIVSLKSFSTVLSFLPVMRGRPYIPVLKMNVNVCQY